MNHAITVGGLLSVVSIIVGLGSLGLFVLMFMATMMSDGDEGGPPLPALLFGIAFIVLGVWGLF